MGLWVFPPWERGFPRPATSKMLCAVAQNPELVRVGPPAPPGLDVPLQTAPKSPIGFLPGTTNFFRRKSFLSPRRLLQNGKSGNFHRIPPPPSPGVGPPSRFQIAGPPKLGVILFRRAWSIPLTRTWPEPGQSPFLFAGKFFCQTGRKHEIAKIPVSGGDHRGAPDKDGRVF